MAWTYPRGCCKTEIKSSTAIAAAIGATPGRVTVHIWSKVLSLRLWIDREEDTHISIGKKKKESRVGDGWDVRR